MSAADEPTGRADPAAPEEASSRNTPRISDVARRARVSSATVSRVLNGTSRVSETLRERVLAAVRELGYVPHGPARALAMRRSHTIGAIIPTVDNAIFAICVQALQDRLSEHGYALLLASSDYSFERERRSAGALLSHGIDALMLVGNDHDPQVYALLARKRIPYLNVWIHHPRSEHPCLGFDNAAAAGALTRFLLDQGHREVAMIAGITSGNDRARERVQGVRAALAARGLGFGPGRFCEAPYEVGAARHATARLLESPSPPTAIVCGNDVQAMGALFECQARGVDVPGEMSVTGYDGLDLAGHVQPPITTVEIPSADMGRLAADDLMARVERREAPRRVELGTRLLVRGTTGPPRRGALAPG